jgi:hypothetical protein
MLSISIRCNHSIHIGTVIRKIRESCFQSSTLTHIDFMFKDNTTGKFFDFTENIVKSAVASVIYYNNPGYAVF